MSAPDTARVRVLARAQCATCDRMEDLVRSVCAETGDAWERVDVDAPGTDPDLRGEYSDRIPVTLVDGVEVGSWRLEEDALRAALAALPGLPGGRG